MRLEALVLLLVFSAQALALPSWSSHYEGKKVLVTGGSSGIGRSVVLSLVESGADVFVGARDPVRLAAILSEMHGRKVSSTQRLEVHSVDVGDARSVKAWTQDLLARHGHIDIAISSAGYCYPAYLEDVPLEHVSGMLCTNLAGPIHVAQALKPHFLSRGQGQIVHVASMASYVNFVGLSVYGATKAGLLSFSRGLQNEFAATQVRVSVVFPSDTQTPGLDAENQTKPEITRIISGGAKTLEPDEVAHSLLAGVAKKRFTIVPGVCNGLIAWLGQHLPQTMLAFFNHQVRSNPPKP